MREIWPDLREMILPRRGLLAFGFVLMVINRVSGLVLPISTKFLIDNVIGQAPDEPAGAAGAGDRSARP